MKGRLAFIFAAALAGPSLADPVEVSLTPPSTKIAYTVYALGLFPIPASFEQFQGTLTADPSDPATCAVHVTVQVASLHMADPWRIAEALGPDMLDAAHYPTMRFDGHCEANGVTALLTMHGVSRELRMSEQRSGVTIVSSGTLRRRDFGVTGLPSMVGQQVELRFTTRLPPAFGPTPSHAPR